MHYMSFFPEFLKDYARAVSIGTRPGGGNIHKSYYMQRGNVGDNVFLGFAIQLGVCCWSDLNAASKRFASIFLSFGFILRDTPFRLIIYILHSYPYYPTISHFVPDWAKKSIHIPRKEGKRKRRLAIIQLTNALLPIQRPAHISATSPNPQIPLPIYHAKVSPNCPFPSRDRKREETKKDKS